ncbi:MULTISPECIES: photosystem I assembly protein Ycf4 [unclassified Roseofilum]|uniref:photosystem I assembly protein Ycf4 n=1 Tax=unclassified Roseofilum TaxID=2620099 RepID=UPI001B047377|nr:MULTISPECIES: photosystem I assembly protein Ycf4 [unclassified Roseofilum]MBP0007524.1 photosystem I assembly protein Ycf4 [Roseofilum sp. Belize Diploria]MBP0012167.1 photosystem I assembly protein Ycf4 [Roseofilum sp. SID3]MBP0026427.1 photosystem I assembly protein Ycf4 [Roseofilum sp. SID2]MBP0035974.1 photosystem I assembly protein Ycf4 [Roseofilum sp. Belize BBD 4]MBP0036725.1 photosystem I assembly protein Ycf4 [Roseofilum sp. SID1]
MTAQGTSTPKNKKVLHQSILGSRRLSNYAWATIISMGASGFLLAGLSSYLQVNLIPFSNPTELIFVPQGLVMGLYGSAGLLLALYLWLVILWDVGGGYNEFSYETGVAKVFRWGFPGKNRQIDLTYPLEDIQAVGVIIKEGLNPQRKIYLRVKGKGNIPLTRVGQPMSLSDLENQAAELARFLEVPLEGL